MSAVTGDVVGEERMLIDGALVPASIGAVFETVNPATEEVLGVAADGARRGHRRRHRRGPAGLRRRRLVDRPGPAGAVPAPAAGRPCERHADELRAMTIAETGSPLFITCSAQLDDPVASLGWVADLAEGYQWETDLGDGRAARACRPAAGCGARPPAWSAAITPWNVPHQINLAKLGPALAAGNTVVLKPAPDTPWCATVLGRLIAEETDIPRRRGQHRPVVGPRLRRRCSSTDPRVDQVSFTGSTATGRKVMAVGGRHAQEGLPRARRQVGLRGPRRRRPAGRLRHGRLHRVHPRRPGLRHHHPAARAPARSFDEAVDVDRATLMAKLPAGDPTDPGTICGPLISARQRDRVEGYLRLAREEGGTIVIGGGRPDGLRPAGSSSSPTLIVGRRQRCPGGPGGDLRPGPGGHPPRRGRRRGGAWPTTRPTGCPARCGRPTATGPWPWPAGSAPAPSASTAACGTAPTCPSAATSSRASGARSGVAGFEEYLETKSMAEPA